MIFPLFQIPVFQIPFNLLNYEMFTVKFLLLNPATAVKKGYYKHVKKLECIEVYMRNWKLGDFSIKNLSYIVLFCMTALFKHQHYKE